MKTTYQDYLKEVHPFPPVSLEAWKAQEVMNHLEDEGNAKQANGCGNVIGMLERQVLATNEILLRREEETNALRSLCAKLRKQNDDNNAQIAELKVELTESKYQVTLLKAELSMAIHGLRSVTDKASLESARMTARATVASIPVELLNELSK